MSKHWKAGRHPQGHENVTMAVVSEEGAEAGRVIRLPLLKI